MHHGATWECKVRWVYHALLHTVPLVLCHVLYEEDKRRVCFLTGFFLWCSIYMEVFGVFVIFVTDQFWIYPSPGD